MQNQMGALRAVPVIVKDAVVSVIATGTALVLKIPPTKLPGIAAFVPVDEPVPM
jgi:hypothetical protein